MVNFYLSSLYMRTTSVIWADVPTAFIGAGPRSVGDVNRFLLFRGF